ncbi:MAG TPA: hypothetical protein VFB21_25935, partial [Chthonomonadaceae bacterium]|nr:hypothetical protein [Chthonomonadaceae bacterium]
MLAASLPMGSAPEPVPLPHFPDRLHAYIWRNWQLVPTERLAKVVGAKPEEILRLGRAMGLSGPPPITPMQQRRSYITVIRRNWHLLPYKQLLALLDWTPEQMEYTLREDDFLFIKLGSLKPKCAPLAYRPPDAQTQEREREIARIVRQEFPQGVGESHDPLFAFVDRLSTPLAATPEHLNTQHLTPNASRFSPRFCSSYFALYGDPLLERDADPYPEGYLARLAEVGVDGVWLQAVLYKLAPFPWEPERSARYEERLKNLRALVTRARRYGIGIYLYLNEPRAMPLAFYRAHPELQGVTQGDYAALCTSAPAVQQYLTDSVASICRAVPDLAGFFTITASENFTHCWSHHHGETCPRCGQRTGAEVLAEVNALVAQGIRQAGSKARLFAWDWGWPDDWAESLIAKLPDSAALVSVSEWSLPIQRGGVESVVGEYSLSAIGPGPRARRHWELARKRGLKTLAKIQAANTWELSTVPYIPALENTARHAANLRSAQIDGLMLGWTLGGYPSPNLEVVAEVGAARDGDADTLARQAMETVARRRFGEAAVPGVVEAWRGFSAAFREFPYHIGTVYTAPMQFGPSNLLWAEPTGYRATMVGFPYDDLDTWRAVYPPEVFISQFNKVADGFDRALETWKGKEQGRQAALEEEQGVAEAAAIHFRSVADQARFVVARRALAAATTAEAARPLLAELERVLTEEIALARRLHALQTRDSRLGFEASNQYS